MKKTIITAISAIAVIASVIGCQVYDSQKNSVLASGMNAAEEGNTVAKWQEMESAFNSACNAYYDNSTDENLRKVADYFFVFDKFYIAALTNVKSYNMDPSADETADTYNVEEVKDCYFKNYMKPGKKYDMYDCIAKYKAKYEKGLADDKATELSKIVATETGYAVKDSDNKERIEQLKKDIEQKYTVPADEYPYASMDVSTDKKTAYSIQSLYEKQYKLRWDYNSKK